MINYDTWVRKIHLPGDEPVTNGMSLDKAKKRGVELAAFMTSKGYGSSHFVYIAPLGQGASRNWAVWVHER